MDMEDRIEKYILDRMTKSERIVFEAELQINPILREKVELEQAIVKQIRSNAYVEKQIKIAKKQLSQEYLEQFVFNLMPEVEKSDFEDNLESNPLLKEQLELELSIVKQIRRNAFVESQITAAKKDVKKGKISRFAFYSITSIAASFLLFFFVHKYFQERKFDELYVSNLKTSSYSDIVQKLISTVDDQDIDTTLHRVDQFNRFDRLRGDDPESQFRSAAYLLEEGDILKAKNIFDELYDLPHNNFIYYEQTRWYLALVHLKLHNKSDVRKYLKEVVSLNGGFRVKAEKLLTDL
jgi:hypothetical protein